MDLEVKAGVNWLGTLYSGGMLVKKPEGKKLYFKITPFSESIWKLFGDYYTSASSYQLTGVKPFEQIRSAIEEVLKVWVLYDLSDLDTESRQLIDQTDYQEELTDKTASFIDRMLTDETLVKEFNIEGNEMVNVLQT